MKRLLPFFLSFLFVFGLNAQVRQLMPAIYQDQVNEFPANNSVEFPETIDLAKAGWTPNANVGSEASFDIFPNPMRYSATLKVNNPAEEVLDLAIYTAAGQLVSIYYDVFGTVELDRTELDRGMYFVSLRNHDGVWITKKLQVN